MINGPIKDILRGYFDEACQELHIDSIPYLFQFEGIGKRFATDKNSAEMEGNTLYINEDWVKVALDNNDDFDLRYIMYHEARHIYQHEVIKDFLKRGKSSELPTTIQSWIEDFSNYARNEGSEDSWWNNISQSVEIDANAFANALLIKHNMGARLAPGQEELMKKAITQMVMKLWGKKLC